MAPVLVTLNDLEGHSPVAGLFKCNPSNILCSNLPDFNRQRTRAVPQRQLGFLSSSLKLHYYGRRIIMTPFVNQQFSLQVVERGRAVQFIEPVSYTHLTLPTNREV